MPASGPHSALSTQHSAQTPGGDVFDIVSKRKWFFLFSGLIMVPGIVFLLLGGLKLGIDFTGGTIWELKFTHPIESLDVRSALDASGYAGSSVQLAEGNTVLIRGRELKEGSDENSQLAGVLR